MPLNCWKEDDDWITDCGYFRLRFSKSKMGISSFAYLAGGNWHEIVNPYGSGLLYLPRLTLAGQPNQIISPYHGAALSDKFIGKAFSCFEVSGYLSNQALGEMPDYPFVTRCSIYEDGDIYLKTSIYTHQGTPYNIIFEEHLLDPKNDPDIILQRDTPPNLKFAGFYSNNPGPNPVDFSADGILVQFQDYFNVYVTYIMSNRKAVGLGTYNGSWIPGIIIIRYFRLHLSVLRSPHDVIDAATFQSIGSDKAFDHRIPDPLNGGPNAGQVLTGSLSGDGYNEAEGTYTVNGV